MLMKVKSCFFFFFCCGYYRDACCGIIKFCILHCITQIKDTHLIITKIVYDASKQSVSAFTDSDIWYLFGKHRELRGWKVKRKYFVNSFNCTLYLCSSLINVDIRRVSTTSDEDLGGAVNTPRGNVDGASHQPTHTHRYTRAYINYIAPRWCRKIRMAVGVSHWGRNLCGW